MAEIAWVRIVDKAGLVTEMISIKILSCGYVSNA